MTDVLLLSAIIRVLDSVESTLLVGYPLLIAASGLWSSVRLVWLTTLFAAIAFSLLILDSDLHPGPLGAPSTFSNIFFAGLAITGFVVARQVRRLCTLNQFYEHRAGA